MRWLLRLRSARGELRVLMAALRDPRTPWFAKAAAVLVVAYAVSPIDLIPDPIPILGLLDDAILLPLGIMLVRRLVPQQVLAECRDAPETHASRGLVRTGLAIVALLWVATIAFAWWLVATFGTPW